MAQDVLFENAWSHGALEALDIFVSSHPLAKDEVITIHQGWMVKLQIIIKSNQVLTKPWPLPA